MLCFKVGMDLKITFIMCLIWRKKCQSRIGGESTETEEKFFFLFSRENNKQVEIVENYWSEPAQQKSSLGAQTFTLSHFCPSSYRLGLISVFLREPKEWVPVCNWVRTLRRKCLRVGRKENVNKWLTCPFFSLFLTMSVEIALFPTVSGECRYPPLTTNLLG